MPTTHSNDLTNIPLFALLDQAAKDHLRQSVRVSNVKKNTIIFERGDAATGFYYVQAGTVKLAVISADGHEKVIEIIQAGMTFGEAVMFINAPFPVFAQTLKPCRLLFIRRESVLHVMRQNPEFSLQMMAGLSRRMHSLVQELEAHCLQNASQRVIGYLLQAIEGQDEIYPVYMLPAAKNIIASRLNLTPETLSRVLRRLQDLEIIRVQGKRIDILDLARLCKLDQCDEGAI